MRRPTQRFLVTLFLFAGTVMFSLRVSAAEPIQIGSRLELMVDDYLIDKMTGASLVLHQPLKREVAINHDAPWEGNNCGYHTVFRDGDLLPNVLRDCTHSLRRERTPQGAREPS